MTDRPEGEPSLADRLADAQVALRGDLEVSRHRFRGEAAYVITDPLTGASHRYDASDYRVLVSLRSDRSLATVFDGLVERGDLDEGDRDRFFEFVFSLHRIGLLKLPVADEDTLYRRHLRRRAARRRSLLTGILFLKIPVWNPDAFLTRTIGWARPLFSRTAFLAWGVLVLAALLTLGRNWSDFTRPVADVFANGNLPLLWITLVALKVLHELGHAYACKHYGGHVPEMGVFLMVFTPCAYVDASSSWTFTRKRDRLVVCLAGMYVEIAIAAGALLLWSVAEPGLVRSVLHNVVVLGSVVTILFNANPLMRYDGYYALSDAIEVPNLRSRATRQGTGWLGRRLLGVPQTQRERGAGLRSFLLAFAACSAVYKVVLVLGISALIATKFYALGLIIGATYVLGTVFGILRRVVPYVTTSRETAEVRARAVGVSVALGVVAPMLALAVPVRTHVSVASVLGFDGEEFVRAETAGFLVDVETATGANVTEGRLLFRLEEVGAEARVAELDARVASARARLRIVEHEAPARADEERARLRLATRELEDARTRLESLTIEAPHDGLIADGLDERDRGRWIARGDVVARIVEGTPHVRALLSESELAGTRPDVGTPVEFRARGAPSRVVSGRVVRVVPLGTRTIPERYASHLDLAPYAIDPTTGEAGKSLFEIEVELSGLSPRLHGISGSLRLPAERAPTGLVVWRKVLVFVRRLQG